MKFRTRSGSVYELDEVGKVARMVSGENTSHRLTRAWRAYEDAMVVIGLPAFIQWTSDTPLLPGDHHYGDLVVTPATQTSEVVEIMYEYSDSETVLH